ncbi:MAG: pilus assembly protein [Pirellulaceae bacterium]|nr:pilus assembly protein [Pirellulaceae bacterium]
MGGTWNHLDNYVRKFGRPSRGKRLGAAAVEFAVVAPLFFLLVFGMVEFGRMVMIQQVITNASREGARKAVLDGATSSNVKSSVVTYMSNGGVTIATSNVTINPTDPASAVAGSPVTVTVSVPFSQVSWLPSPMFLGSRQMTASTVMRREAVD